MRPVITSCVEHLHTFSLQFPQILFSEDAYTSQNIFILNFKGYHHLCHSSVAQMEKKYNLVHVWGEGRAEEGDEGWEVSILFKEFLHSGF